MMSYMVSATATSHSDTTGLNTRIFFNTEQQHNQNDQVTDFPPGLTDRFSDFLFCSSKEKKLMTVLTMFQKLGHRVKFKHGWPTVYHWSATCKNLYDCKDRN